VKTLQSVGFEADADSMSRRLTGALLSVLALALVPASASAQTPDEHAAARAFTDIAIRAVADLEAAAENVGIDSPDLGASRCTATRRFNKRATEKQKEALYDLYAAHYIGRITRAETPVLARTVGELDAVSTADPALIKGREAWHRVHAAYAEFGRFPHVHICTEMRKYVRSDFRRTRLMRRAARYFRRADGWNTNGIDRAMARAEQRLVALGIPAAEADAFDGDYERESSSLKSLRAAR
jgi:hypothetical protein